MGRNQFFYIMLLSFILLLASRGSPLSDDIVKWPSTDDYWRMIRAAASAEYSGMDINLTLNTSYTYDPDERSHGGTLGISIPLFSKQDKLTNRSEASAFLSLGAVLIQKLETALSQKKISIEQSKFLQAKFQQEGVVAVTAYFDVLKQIASLSAQIAQYHRELQSLINPFHTPKILPVYNETSLVQP